ncbi:MAG TPA: ABC transporter substrate-binding protein, partial [Clostridiales bacterium]|nr:ABC transporter substrate-binding protein [Clostridiales bacterium]
MKNKLAKLTSALLAAFIAASLFACGSSGDAPSADTTAPDMNAAETAETTAAE